MGICNSKLECTKCKDYELFINDNDDMFTPLPWIREHKRKNKYKNLKKQNLYKIYNDELKYIKHI